MPPSKVTVRSYQVGFGDCYLLTFHYGGNTGERHVLIDCGSTEAPKGAKKFSLVPVAQDIAQRTNNKLHAVVATHRHKDHISGFTTAANGKGAGDIIRALKPDLVLQPWTEDPTLPTDARKPKSARAASGKYALGLQGMHAFSEGLLEEVKGLHKAVGVKTLQQLNFLGDDNLANKSAVDNLMAMGKKNEYLHYRKKTGLEQLLPGVKVHVLGPPTLEQNAGIAKQRSSDAAEFWQLRGAAARSHSARARSPFGAAHRMPAKDYPPEVRWIIPRVQACRGAQLLELVRILDDQMNNTSLILLFEFDGKKLLFPGDAQIENWNHALVDAKEAKANRTLLADTDLYKVGHHGSRNATPKTLWNLFAKKGNNKGPLKTMMSTKSGVHGDVARKTEVPRRSLLQELGTRSALMNTEGFSKKRNASKSELYDEVEI